MEPETVSLRLWYRRTRSITSLSGSKSECLRINFDGICCEPSGTMKSQEQDVTSERN